MENFFIQQRELVLTNIPDIPSYMQPSFKNSFEVTTYTQWVFYTYLKPHCTLHVSTITGHHQVFYNCSCGDCCAGILHF
jgi:hypothetical protein